MLRAFSHSELFSKSYDFSPPYIHVQTAAYALSKKGYKILSKKGRGGDIEPQLKKNQIDYDFISNNSELRKITKGSFPTFLFYKKGSSEAKAWDNNAFGTMALDYIEDH